jgi:hypothetical protein
VVSFVVQVAKSSVVGKTLLVSPPAATAKRATDTSEALEATSLTTSHLNVAGGLARLLLGRLR